MSSKRVNVLVYSGPGSTVESVRHCLYSLRRLLSPNYAVIPVTAEAVLKEPWTSTCALFVMPGGADLGYCRLLNGEGNRKIKQYVQRGGSYLGFCAGGYYGSSRCEFMIGQGPMEVVGERELAFYPDACRGLAFPGFRYQSEAGARAAELQVDKAALAASGGNLPETLRVYFNGGGVFVNAPKYRSRGVEVLASYTEQLEVDPGEGSAAVVYCKVGEGNAILTGSHPEFAAANISKHGQGEPFKKAVEALEKDDKLRSDFFKACLQKLGLQVNTHEQSVPSLSRLHLSAYRPSDVSELVFSWQDIISTGEHGEEVIRGGNDLFVLEKSHARFSQGNVTHAAGNNDEANESSVASSDSILDYDAIPKHIVIHEKELPSAKETPYFNHQAFFSNLHHYISKSNNHEGVFGKYLLYGEVVTSTSTMLEKNPTLLRHLSPGFTATATSQIAGRGRGSNVWVSPPGSLMFSTVLRHSISLTPTAPVVFIQYLAALAIVSAVHTYEPGYGRMPVRLKWPNDVYALDPQTAESKDGNDRERFVKIGGILVNSSYSGSDYTLVVGVGLNVSNTAPTTGLNSVASTVNLAPFQVEKLLARILTCFEEIYTKFCRDGWSRELERDYYKYWLHTDQIVTLEAEGGVRARIKGVTRDWGLLLAEELDPKDMPVGKTWQLQSDSNSFDFFKGLVKRKV